MAFWSSTGPEPKRQYRWIVLFGSRGLDNIRFALKKVDKPKAKINSVQHKYLNHFFNYPGRLEWEDINMTFASISEPDATYLLNNVLINAGYGVPKSQGSGEFPDPQVSTIGKNKFADALGKKMSIIQIDADGGYMEEWQINNPFFTSVQFGSLDYGSEEIVEITTTVKYDWAQLISPTGENGNSSSDTDKLNPGFPSR